jgi:O-antigen ligase
MKQGLSPVNSGACWLLLPLTRTKNNVNTGTETQKPMVTRAPVTMPRLFTIVLILLSAAVLGYAVATYGSVQRVLPVILFIVCVPLILAVGTIEWLIWISLISNVLIECWFIPSSALFFLRFIPMGLLACYGIVVSSVNQAKLTVTPKFLLYPMALMGVLALLSTFYAVDPSNTFQRGLALTFGITSFGISIPLFITEQGRRRQSAQRFMMVCLVSVMLSMVAYVARVPQAISEERLSGIYSNANTLGVVAMFVLVMLIGWFLDATTRNSRIAFGLAFVVTLSATLLSGSRASLLGALAGFMVFLAFSHSRAKLRGVWVLIIVLGIVLTVLPIPEVHIFSPDASLRDLTWKAAFDLGMRSPVLGTGFSTDKITFDNTQIISGIRIRAGHNEYLRIFMGLGVTGLVVLLVTLVILVLKAVQTIRRVSGTDSIWIQSLLAAVVAGMVNAIFEDGLLAFGGVAALLFWYLAFTLAIEIQTHSLRLGRA